MRDYYLTIDTVRHAPPIMRSEVPACHGACDALVAIHLVRDDSRSSGMKAAVFVRDGRVPPGVSPGRSIKRLGAEPLWDAWMELTATLAKDARLDDGRRVLLARALDGAVKR